MQSVPHPGCKHGHFDHPPKGKEYAIMRTFWFSGLLALTVACTGDIDYNDDDTAGDGGSVTQATGSFVGPQVEFLGGLEDCTSVLKNEDGKIYTANSGVSLELAVGTYTVTFGDTALATAASGNLPIHPSPTGWTTITPAVTVEIEEGVEHELPSSPVMNGYVNGEWTCDFIDGDGSSARPGEVTYIEGVTAQFSMGDLIVTGLALSVSDPECIGSTGQFISLTELNHEVNCGGEDGLHYVTQCWKGDYEARP